MSSPTGQRPPLGAEVQAGIARNGDIQLAWRSHGRGQPVLVIMGFLGTGHAWFRLLPYIAAMRRAIVFDNRGTGDSERPPGLWSMGDLAGDALAVLDATGVESAHVVGASMGGMIAQHLALEHPGRVRSLTLACTHAGRREGRPGWLPWRLVAAIALRPALGSTRAFGLLAPLLYSDRTLERARDRLEEDLELRVRDATPLLTAAGQLAAIARHDARARLGELRVPALVLHGEEDRLIPPAAAHELARRIPHARLELIRDCGHVLTAEAEPEAARAILAFLDEVETGPASAAGGRT